MLDKKIVITAFVVLSGGILLIQPATAQARGGYRDHDRGHHRSSHSYDRYHRYPHGRSVVYLPFRSVSIIFSGQKYYYCDGIYYRHVANRYVTVAPPQEILVSTNGKVQDNSGKTFIVNVPNSYGGYTQVALKGTKDGYIGPQGEFYNDFPDIEQLKAMYTK